MDKKYRNEEWRDVKGFEGLYHISSFGRIKSFKQYAKGLIMSLKNKNGDYFRVVLQVDILEKKKSVSVHRLVAETFIPNPNNLPEVNHIDGNKQNNHVDNLEWVTSRENTIHSLSINKNQLTGIKNYNFYERPNPIAQIDKIGTIIAIYPNAQEAGRRTGICSRNILQVCHREPKRKTAGKYIWRFESEVISI